VTSVPAENGQDPVKWAFRKLTGETGTAPAQFPVSPFSVQNPGSVANNPGSAANAL
jgi:hypothetical protein